MSVNACCTCAAYVLCATTAYICTACYAYLAYMCAACLLVICYLHTKAHKLLLYRFDYMILHRTQALTLKGLTASRIALAVNV
jgi:hypothetical protein